LASCGDSHRVRAVGEAIAVLRELEPALQRLRRHVECERHVVGARQQRRDAFQTAARQHVGEHIGFRVHAVGLAGGRRDDRPHPHDRQRFRH
jgi:hypothetical protein